MRIVFGLSDHQAIAFSIQPGAARCGSTMTADGLDFNGARCAGGMLDSLGPGSIADILSKIVGRQPYARKLCEQGSIVASTKTVRKAWGLEAVAAPTREAVSA